MRAARRGSGMKSAERTPGTGRGPYQWQNRPRPALEEEPMNQIRLAYRACILSFDHDH